MLTEILLAAGPVLADTPVLERTVPSSAGIDFFRIVAAVMGVVVILFAVHRFLDHSRFWGPIAFICLGFLGLAEAVARLGEPFIPWKLPLLLAGNLAALVVLYRNDPLEGSA